MFEKVYFLCDFGAPSFLAQKQGLKSQGGKYKKTEKKINHRFLRFSQINAERKRQEKLIADYWDSTDYSVRAGKLRNRQILLDLTVLVCYYWTKIEMFGFLIIEPR